MSDFLNRFTPRFHKKQFCICVISSFTFIFTLLSIIDHYIKLKDSRDAQLLYANIICSLAFGACMSYARRKVTINLPLTNTKLKIQFGDLFKAKGVRAIPANVFFDTELGKHVSKTSIHGLFIDKAFERKSDALYSQIIEKLNDFSHEEIAREAGRKKRFPTGTCVAIKGKDGNDYLLLALADTDIATCMASCDVTKMWTALIGLLEKAREELNGRELCLPLIGSGLAKVGLPNRELLQLIVLSIVCETKIRQIADTITIILHKRLYGEIDLNDIAKYWSHYHGL